MEAVGSGIPPGSKGSSPRRILSVAEDRHPMAWRPSDVDPASCVIYVDRNEVARALEAFKAHGVDGDAVNRDNFPLPSLAILLEQAVHNIHEGTGFVIIRGIDPNEYTPEDNMVVFLGLASYIGDVRGVQDKRGTMITHITEAKHFAAVPRELRHGIHTNTGLAFHTDMSVDILALHVRATAEKGGNTFLASSWTIYQELAATSPGILHTLSQPSWPLQVSGNPPRYILAPLLQVYQGKVLFSVDPGRLGLHPVTSRQSSRPCVPELTSDQREALAAVSKLATQNSFPLNAQSGDMIFINNWSLLHARESYIDSDVNPRRHLVRLWLRNSERAWEIPQSMKAPWEAAFGPNGDGNPVYLVGSRGTWKLGVEKSYPVVPAPVYKPPKFTAGSAAFMLEDDDDVNAECSLDEQND